MISNQLQKSPRTDITPEVETLTHPKYRPDVDGLRAIAILSVIAFHVFPTWIRGGFIGVDIFFVISGYLISSIIFENLQRHSFSFTEFYVRRINRIFPTLLLMLVFCYSLGWFTLLAGDYQLLGKHIAGGAGFISNLMLWNESGYFAKSAEITPLLHLWSLGIEEQFYIGWPLLLWIAWKSKLNLLAVAIALALVSFTLNVYTVRVDAVAAFYSPQTRFWELMVGTLLAYLGVHFQPALVDIQSRLDVLLRNMADRTSLAVNTATLRSLQSMFGLMLIVAGFVIIASNRRFPGVWALLPTIGAALIITAGSKAWLNRTVLSSRILVWVGLISFPLYIWHWPLLVFLNIVRGSPPTTIDRIFMVVVAIVLSVLTYRLVERPIRTGGHRRSLAIVLLTLMTVMGCAGYDLFRRGGFPFRVTEPSGDYTKYGQSLKALDISISSCPAVTGVQDSWCRTTEFPTIALIGDSHADQMMERFLRSGNPEFGRLISLGAGNCQPSLDSDSALRCVKQISAALDAVVANPAIEYVVVSSWNTEVKDRLNESIEGYKRTFDRLRKSHKKVVYVVDIPTLKTDPGACVNTTLEFRERFRKPPNLCVGAGPEDVVSMDEYLKLVLWIKSENPDVFVYDPRQSICPDGICKVMEQSIPVYSDAGHLSDFGGQSVIDSLIVQIQSHFGK
jgi:peptidoglycan/LPS O-acetylase OafA/YrhL